MLCTVKPAFLDQVSSEALAPGEVLTPYTVFVNPRPEYPWLLSLELYRKHLQGAWTANWAGYHAWPPLGAAEPARLPAKAVVPVPLPTGTLVRARACTARTLEAHYDLKAKSDRLYVVWGEYLIPMRWLKRAGVALADLTSTGPRALCTYYLSSRRPMALEVPTTGLRLTSDPWAK